MATDEELLKHLEVQIHRLELDLSQLAQIEQNRKKNALSPISQLAPDILCEIFRYNVLNIDCEGRGGSTPTYPAIQISHVSHSWRAIAHAHPEIWGDPNVEAEVRTTEVQIHASTMAENMMCPLERDGTITFPQLPTRSGHPPIPTTTNQGSGRQLDDHIHQLKLELSELRQRKNSLSPISQLPSEVFFKIFAFSIPNIDYKNPEGRMKTHAMKISHVSQSWRAATVACPELWGNLNIGVRTTEKALTFALTRARAQNSSALLSINMCGFERDGHPSVPSQAVIATLSKVIRADPTRFRHFSLYTDESSFRSLFDQVSGGFDNLASLKLDIVRTDGVYADLDQFLYSFPQLRCLEIKRPIVFSEQLPPCPKMADVDIHCVYVTKSTVYDILAFMKGAANLQTFQIGELHLPHPVTLPTGRGDNSLHLPDLKMVRLPVRSPLGTYWGTEVVSHLLSHISIPINCRAHIACRTRTPRHTRDVMSSLKSAYGRLAPLVLEICSTLVEVWGDWQLPGYLAGQLGSEDQWITVAGSTSASCTIWEWGWSFCSLRVLKITFLVNSLGVAGREFWRYLAENAPCLEEIRTGQCLKSIPGDFMECIRRGRGVSGGTEVLLWPSLKKLCSPLPAKGDSGYVRVRDDVAMPPLHIQVEYALDLVAALKAREKAGPQAGVEPLKILTFTSPFSKESQPLNEETTCILHSGALKVAWKIERS
ncbi:hypothetical protein NMY22_g4434 [Coprinellus aureogranulatus]|nr:hypothetical protein NMY22_g4434 [Coprinellus aureogranulatus]